MRLNRFLAAVACCALSVSASAFAEVQRPKAPAKLAQNQQGPEIDIAFVLDTTSSMAGMIEGAKQKIWSIASNIARGQPAPHLKIALVAYRDVGDTYVAMHFGFTDDLDTVFANLRNLRAEGGGDSPEHVGRGLGEAVSKLEWSGNAKTMKTLFLIGDAPPADRHDDWNYKTWAKAAARKGIVVNTLRCGSDSQTAAAWREISSYSSGTFATIEQNGGVVAMTTPYDRELEKLNAEMAHNTLYAGARHAREASRAKSEAVAAMPAESAASRQSFMSTGSAVRAGATAAPAATLGARDLVSAPAALDKLSADEMPEELAGLDAKARKEKVQALAKERVVLAKKSAELSAQRQGWIEGHAKDNAKGDALDVQVMGAIRSQAKKSGIAY